MPVTTPPQRPDIARDLIIRSTRAREYRRRLHRGQASDSEISLGQHVDHANGQVLRRLVSAHGWPGRRLVSEAGAKAAWQLALYADSLQDFQRLALRLLATAVEHGEATVQQWAHLYDRCSINAGDPQLYGTQRRLGPAEVETPPIRDREDLDARRASVGLPPFRPTQPAVRLRPGCGPETLPAGGAPTGRVLVGATV
ncbi:DUF6624 domain-containing protein [Streptomyces sp. NPDC021100]|uniref:DUF6624 domain-containing protein n=1 Tax=Streptomyces sp. NPDC021100 TaxID=3365114 RepID=UPI003787C5E3